MLLENDVRRIRGREGGDSDSFGVHSVNWCESFRCSASSSVDSFPALLLVAFAEVALVTASLAAVSGESEVLSVHTANQLPPFLRGAAPQSQFWLAQSTAGTANNRYMINQSNSQQGQHAKFIETDSW